MAEEKPFYMEIPCKIEGDTVIVPPFETPSAEVSVELRRVRFVRFLPDGTVFRSVWGSWTQAEIDSIMDLHRLHGQDVTVEDEWPETIYEDILDAEVVL